MAAVHARSCPLQMAWTWCSYGQRYIRLVQLCGSFEVSRNAFSCHTIAALLVVSLNIIFPSAFAGPWLPIPDSYGVEQSYNGEMKQNWDGADLVQFFSSYCSFWCWNLKKLVDAALKGALCLGSCLNCEDAANAADSTPDAPQCQADILAISAADLFV